MHTHDTLMGNNVRTFRFAALKYFKLQTAQVENSSAKEFQVLCLVFEFFTNIQGKAPLTDGFWIYWSMGLICAGTCQGAIPHSDTRHILGGSNDF